MHLIRLFVIVKAVDCRVALHCILLLLGYYFRVKNDGFVNASNTEVFGKFLVNFASVSFVNSCVLYGGVVEIGFLLKARKYIRDNAILWYENIVSLLSTSLATSTHNFQHSIQTSFWIPSLTQVTFRIFLVSISLTLMSKTS